LSKVNQPAAGKNPGGWLFYAVKKILREHNRMETVLEPGPFPAQKRREPKDREENRRFLLLFGSVF